MTLAFGLSGNLGPDIQGFPQVHAIDAGRDHRRHGRSAGNAQAGVMGDLARLDHRLDKPPRVADIGGDAHRGDAHGRAIGGAVAPGFFRGMAGEDHVDRALGGRPEQVLGAFGAHVCFPIDQALGKHGGLDLALALHQ